MKKLLNALRIAIGIFVFFPSIGLLFLTFASKSNVNKNPISLVANVFIGVIILFPKLVYWGKNKALQWICPIFMIILGLWFSGGYTPKTGMRQSKSAPITSTPSKCNIATKISFKEFLKKQNASLDINVPNKFETMQPNKNVYSNYYFNVAVNLPDHWDVDRGMAPNSIIRAFNSDSGKSLALNVIPLGVDYLGAIKIKNEFHANPISYMDKMYNGNYSKVLLDQIKQNQTSVIDNFNINAERIRNLNYLVYSYNYSEIDGNNTVLFKSCNYQTCIWGNLFTYFYTCPDYFYDSNVIERTVSSANYTNPYLYRHVNY